MVLGEEVVVGEDRLRQSKSVSLFPFFLTFVNTKVLGLGRDGWKAYFLL